MISAIIVFAALVVAYFIARVLWGDYQAQRRSERQRRCREWIEWKLRGESEVDRYEAQCAFRMLITDPEWTARGPWEYEETPGHRVTWRI